MDGFSGHHQQQQNSGSFWYPSSSSPPPPPAGYHHPPPPHLLQNSTLIAPPFHHQQSYTNQLPINPPPQHQMWFHPPQQPALAPPQPSPMSHYPPPYHSQHGLPPPYPPPHHHYHPPPPPHPMAPPPSSAYPPSGQAWGNPSWQQHQLWEYPDRNITYNNEDDWAAKARAWAAADSMPESHHAHSQFTQLGRIEERDYTYRDHLPKVVAPVDKLPPLAQSNGRALYNEDENVARETSHLTPPPRSYYPSSSVYEQEVPYTYSSSQDHREAMDHRERPHEILHSQFAPPVQLSSVEPYFNPGNQSAKLSYDISDQPLDFQPKSTIGLDQLKQFSFSHVDRSENEGIMDQNIPTTSTRAWNSTAAPVVTFPTIPLAPSGTQFDPLIVSQPSLPAHSAPAFGGVAVPNFKAPISPVSMPYGLGTSLHATNFLGDGNGSLSLVERPKKAAVPNWLREEIIKKKSSIATTNSLHSGVVEMEDADMSFRKTDQSDDKSLDSRRSIEDEDDDEDEVEAARTAAINQEIKRVLTEVLLKVTDEIFDEIATKVLDEDEPNSEVVDSTNIGNPKFSPPSNILGPKETTKVLVPPITNRKNVDSKEISRPNILEGDLLGLANYDSDASKSDNDDEKRAALSRKLDGTSHRLETASRSDKHSLKDVKTGKESDANGDVQSERKISLSDSRERKKVGQSNAKAPGVSEASEKISSTNCEIMGEIGLDDNKGLKSVDTTCNESVKRHESANRDTTTKEECRDGETNILHSADQKMERSMKSRGPIKDISGGSHSNNNENIKYGDNPKDKREKRGNLFERLGDRNVKQVTNERETHSKSISRNDNIKVSKTEILKDKGEKQRGYERRNDRKRDHKEHYRRDEKEEPSKFSRNSFKRKVRSKSPVSIDRHGKDNSIGSRGSASSEESSDNSRKRKLQSRGSSVSASPIRSTKRQVSRSPHSRHSHSRHSPFSTARRNRRSRSRSISPIRRRRPSKA